MSHWISIEKYFVSFYDVDKLRTCHENYKFRRRWKVPHLMIQYLIHAIMKSSFDFPLPSGTSEWLKILISLASNLWRNWNLKKKIFCCAVIVRCQSQKARSFIGELDVEEKNYDKNILLIIYATGMHLITYFSQSNDWKGLIHRERSWLSSRSEIIKKGWKGWRN